MRRIIVWSLAAGLVVAGVAAVKAWSQEKTPVIVLDKAGEIPERFGTGPEDYFWNIRSLCFDSADILFVADRGWNRIFKLDSKGGSLKSFGGKGQGPGEFSADTGSFLGVTVGNDGFLYVSDERGARLSRFDREGQFLKSFPLASGSAEPAINSNGEIFLVLLGDELISVFSQEMKLQNKFFQASLHFDKPFLKPYADQTRRVNHFALPILMTADDRLVAVSNISLEAFVFGPDLREIDRFGVGDEAFRAALRKKYDALIKRMIEQGMTPPRANILPFLPVVAPGNRLLLFTFNEERNASDAYVYSFDGRLEAMLQVPEGIQSPFAVNRQGEIFGIKDETAIVRFRPPFPR